MSRPTSLLAALWRSQDAAAAAEMALSLPLLLIILFGGTEAGFYFYSEHKLVESVRDGARYAGRQSFNAYPCGSTINPTVDANIRNVVRTGRVNGTEDRLPRWDEAIVDVTYVCTAQMETVPGSGSFVPVGGIYQNAGVAPVVTIDAQVPFQSLFGFVYGFPSGGIQINAEQVATVAGI